jgi:uncharacterized protein (TIGR03435 family)
MKKIILSGALLALSAFAQQPKFDLADVHASTTPRGFAQNFGGVLRAGRYVNRDATMLNLIQAAYGLSEDNISGGPGWIASDIFEVVGKVPDGTNMAKANQMLQSLLEERFHLVMHKGEAPVPRFVLSGKGSKLKAAGGSGSPGCQPLSQGGPPPGPGPVDLASIPNIQVECHNLTAAEIADNLRQMAGGYLDHDLIDQTGLDGSYDFNLEWSGRGVLAAKGAAGISIFDAVDKQLGLKLELKNVNMPVQVIQSVNRKPTPNPPEVATGLVVTPARFEAASIKPATPERQMTGLLYTGGSQMRAGGNIRELIAMSLQVPPNVAGDMLIGVPKSTDSQKWDIVAKVPSTGEGAPNLVRGQPQPPPLSVGLEMLRGLMIDRFGLKAHSENREITVYALVTTGAKPKLTRAEETERTNCKPDANAPKPVANMGPMISCRNTSMAELAENLQGMANAYIDHPIVDGTGLEGGWNFLMGWTPKGALTGPVPTSTGDGATSDPGGISVFEAVEKELGLKLVKQTKSIPVIVVDHVNDKPVE